MKYNNTIISSMIVQMEQTFARNMFKFTLFINPILSTVILGEMYRFSSQVNFLSFVVLGSGVWNMWGCIAFSSVGDIQRERYSKTLSIIFSTPADFRLILFGKVIGNTILSFGSFMLSTFVAIVLYGSDLYVQNPMLLVGAVVLTSIAFLQISIFFAYLLTLSRRTTLYMNCIEIPFAIICGFVFPIEMLPQIVRFIGYIFPPTWAIRLMRMSVVDTSDRVLPIFIMYLITLVSFTYFSKLLYRIIVRQVKISGTLEMD